MVLNGPLVVAPRPIVGPVVVRPLAVRTVVSHRRRRRPLSVSPSRRPSRRRRPSSVIPLCVLARPSSHSPSSRRPSSVRPSRRPSNYCLHDVTRHG